MMSGKEVVWVTRDGRRVLPSEMTPGHLRNAAAWCARELEQMARHNPRSEMMGAYLERQEIVAREWDRRYCLDHEDCRQDDALGEACREAGR